LLYGKAAAVRHQQLGGFKAHIDGKRKVMGNLERISEVAQAMRGALEKRTGKRPAADARRMAFP